MIVAGASIIALSMYNLTSIYGDVGFWYLAHSRMLLGVGLPLIFLSITAASYEGIAADKVDQASALVKRRAQHRRLAGHRPVVQRARPSRAVPSEPAG